MEDKVRIKNLKSLLAFFEKFGREAIGTFFRKFHVTPIEGRGEKRLEENLNYFLAEKNPSTRVGKKEEKFPIEPGRSRKEREKDKRERERKK